MKTETVTVTRRTRNIGFAWTGGIPPIERPSRPEYTGTLRTVLRRVGEDRTLQTVRSGNIFHVTAFFVDGEHIVYDDEWRYGVDLLLDGIIDSLTLTVEK